jgi:hypothetical protein
VSKKQIECESPHTQSQTHSGLGRDFISAFLYLNWKIAASSVNKGSNSAQGDRNVAFFVVYQRVKDISINA